MNAQSTVLAKAITSDNLQDTLLTIRSKVFSVQAQNIEETVEGTANLNSEYKEYDIGGKFHESYTGPYEVNQQSVKSKIGSLKFASDKYIANANYKHTRKGNTIKLVSLGSTQICIGVNSAHRIGILGSTSLFKDKMIVGAAAKLTLLGVSLSMSNTLLSLGAGTSVVGLHKELAKVLTHKVDLYSEVSTAKKWSIINKDSTIVTPGGTIIDLYT